MNSATTVRELVTQRPETTRVFEKFKIDYCCRGNTPLVEACEKAGVDLRESKHELEHIGRVVLRELRRVTSDYAVPADACISYKTLYDALEALERDLHQHIHLENNILFPRAIDLEQMIGC